VQVAIIEETFVALNSYTVKLKQYGRLTVDTRTAVFI